MKNKKLIFGSISLVGLILLILPMFLNMWKLTNSIQDGYFKIFGDYSGAQFVFENFAQFWITLVDVIAVIGLILAVAYTVLFVLEMLKIGNVKLFAKIRKMISFALLLLCVVAIISAIVCVCVNKNKLVAITMAVGTYLLFVGLAVMGLFGLLSTGK